MKFTKMHGAGNDYIYVNGFEETIKDRNKFSIKVSDRHFGIGSDGLIVVDPSEVADCKMDMYNADGSQGKMCGNGVRCVAKFVYDNGIVNKEDIAIETLSGIKYIKVTVKDGKVVAARVNMGKPILKADEIPTKFEGKTVVSQKLSIGENDYDVTCVSMGNPHCILYVDDVKTLDLEKIGPDFENHEMFPDRINTEFIHIISETEFDMRVWERGSGETLACGTGACAATVASVLNGYCKRNTDIKVNLIGGTLTVNWTDGGDVYMTGPAETVCTGEIDE
ncbi:MAG: diaminopimelate epimerase [Clostridiaceae bacterium]|nr:diaminopimelate epimerase [Clostridiaceae bacterium]